MMKRLTYHEFLANPDFRFRVQVLELHDQTVPVHCHEFTELAVILGGAARHQVAPPGKGEGAGGGDAAATIDYPIGAGDVFVIGRRAAHGYTQTARLRLCNILFDPEQTPALRADLQRLPGYHALFHLEPAYRVRDHFASRLRLEPEELARAGALIARMDHEQSQQGPGMQTLLQALFSQLIVELVRCYSRQRTPVSPQVLRLARVMAFLEEHYAEKIHLSELAAQAHMSVNNLLRVFRQVYQTSPADYLIRLRLAKACELMRERTLTLSEIAYAVGFNDGNYFSRQFRQVYGAAPRAYRAWLRSDPAAGVNTNTK